MSDALDAALATAYDVMENATTAGEIKKCKDALTKAIKGFYADRKTGTKQGGNSGSGSGSSGTGSGYTQTEPTPEAKVVDNSAVYEPKVVVGDDGVGSVSINSDTLDALLDSMGDSLSGSNGGSSTGALGGSGQDTIDTLVIDTNNSASTENADGISFTMEGKALNRLSSETDLNLSIESLNASLFLPSEILDDLSEKTKNMQLNVNIQKGLEEEVPEALLQEAKFEFAAAAKVGLKTGKEKVTQFGDHQAIVSIPVTNSGNMPRNPVIIAISDDGRTDYLEGTYDGRLVRVPTTHLTTFVVTTMAYEEFAKDLGFITFNDDYVTLYVGGNTGKTLLPYTFTDDVRVVAKDAKVKKGTKPVIRMSAYISDGDSDVLTVGKKGKLTAKKEGKVVVTYEYVNEKGEKRSHIIYVTVEKASIKFTKSLKKLTEGSMKTYKIALFGYKPESITWSTIKKKKAVVGRNEGKLVARVYAVTAGKDTLFVKVDGKKLKKLNIEVVGK